MLKFILTLVLLAGIVSIAEAYASQCTTTCSTVGNYTTCQQNCW